VSLCVFVRHFTDPVAVHGSVSSCSSSRPAGISLHIYHQSHKCSIQHTVQLSKSFTLHTDPCLRSMNQFLVTLHPISRYFQHLHICHGSHKCLAFRHTVSYLSKHHTTDPCCGPGSVQVALHPVQPVFLTYISRRVINAGIQHTSSYHKSLLLYAVRVAVLESVF
jgi:hypothetical protein